MQSILFPVGSESSNISYVDQEEGFSYTYKTEKGSINGQYVCADAITQYDSWPTPMMIMCDGPYGVSGYKGDLHTHMGLAEWYEPHIKAWSKKATPQTTLWFWNSEIGWATVHPILEKYGWEYKSCSIWDKGIGHIAGNCNTKTLSSLPVVSEVCVHYVKRPSFNSEGVEYSMKEWLIREWKRTGLPRKKANEACGVVDAASRKWLTKDHLWYMPPSNAFEQLVQYANEHGKPEGRPYFSIDGKTSLTKEDWEKYRPKFYCPLKKTNVWQQPQLKTEERIKHEGKAVHNNQKPIVFIEDLIRMTTDELDCVWDPFGGLATTVVCGLPLKRSVYSCEIDKKMFEVGKNRIKLALNKLF